MTVAAGVLAGCVVAAAVCGLLVGALLMLVWQSRSSAGRGRAGEVSAHARAFRESTSSLSSFRMLDDASRVSIDVETGKVTLLCAHCDRLAGQLPLVSLAAHYASSNKTSAYIRLDPDLPSDKLPIVYSFDAATGEPDGPACALPANLSDGLTLAVGA